MRHIDKTKAPLPLLFLKWLQDNETVLQAKVNDSSVTGGQIWDFFRSNKLVYDELKEALVEYQGCICCYCGQRIFADYHTAIEHLFPKTKYKYLTLHFCNLLASCKGGCQSKIHIVKSNETLEQIADLYGVDIEHLEDVWVNIDNKQRLQKEYDIENLSVGDRIIIFLLLPDKEQHCDTKKDKFEIDIYPLQTDCQNHFSYNPTDGKIIVTEKNKLTVKRLGLNNNRYINQLRKKVLDEAYFLQQNLINDFGHSPSVFNTNRMKITSNLNDVTKNGGKLESFVFVKIWRLNN